MTNCCPVAPTGREHHPRRDTDPRKGHSAHTSRTAQAVRAVPSLARRIPGHRQKSAEILEERGLLTRRRVGGGVEVAISATGRDTATGPTPSTPLRSAAHVTELLDQGHLDAIMATRERLAQPRHQNPEISNRPWEEVAVSSVRSGRETITAPSLICGQGVQ